MKRVLAFLTSIIFLTISQAGLIHTMDMRIMHSNLPMPVFKMFTPKDATIFCSKNIGPKQSSCFQEIPESKWIVSGTYKIFEVFQIIFFIFFALYSALALIISNKSLLAVQNVLWPPKNTYQSLFGVIRNNN